MVMTLLELVEGRNTTPLREAMVRLERGVRHLLTETGSSGAKPMIHAAPETPAVVPQPARPVLVQSQSEARVHTPRAAPLPAEPTPDRDAADANDALVELTSLGRSDAEGIVKEPPEISAPVAQIIRRLSDSAAAASDA